MRASCPAIALPPKAIRKVLPRNRLTYGATDLNQATNWAALKSSAISLVGAALLACLVGFRFLRQACLLGPQIFGQLGLRRFGMVTLCHRSFRGGRFRGFLRLPRFLDHRFLRFADGRVLGCPGLGLSGDDQPRLFGQIDLEFLLQAFANRPQNLDSGKILVIGLDDRPRGGARTGAVDHVLFKHPEALKLLFLLIPIIGVFLYSIISHNRRSTISHTKTCTCSTRTIQSTTSCTHTSLISN